MTNEMQVNMVDKGFRTLDILQGGDRMVVVARYGGCRCNDAAVVFLNSASALPLGVTLNTVD